MHYYTFHIGDYTSHTARLSLMEDLAYRRMLDEYYLSEKPFIGSAADVARQIGMSDQLQSVEYVLSLFFTDTWEGFSSRRCDSEIAAYRDKQAKASAAGKASAQRRFNVRSTSVEEISTPVEKLATDVQPTNNQEPITNNQKNISPNGDRQPSADNCPHAEILDLFAEQLPQLTQPLRSRWSGSKGAEALRTRWREDKRHQSIEFWNWFFGIVQSSKFHLGENERGWKADLPWLLKRENFDKMLARGVQG